MFRLIKNRIKYWVASIWFESIVKDFKPDIDEAFRQKWTHLQGQILTKGRMKWNWGKLIGKNSRRN